MLQKETRTAMEECKEAHREGHKICRYKRKEYEEEKLSVETYNTRSESRKFYQEVRRLNKRSYQPQSTICKD
jgi:hypothetical protein